MQKLHSGKMKLMITLNVKKNKKKQTRLHPLYIKDSFGKTIGRIKLTPLPPPGLLRFK